MSRVSRVSRVARGSRVSKGGCRGSRGSPGGPGEGPRVGGSKGFHLAPENAKNATIRQKLWIMRGVRWDGLLGYWGGYV